MMEGYYLQRDTEIQQFEVMAADESRRPVTFKEWLMRYEWEWTHADWWRRGSDRSSCEELPA